MPRSPALALSDPEVLKRVQHLGDALAASIAQNDPPPLDPFQSPRRSEDGWQHQVKLLEDLALLISDGVSARLAFVGWVSLYLKNALISLLESRRSAVALAAMAVLNCLVLRSSSTSRTAASTICSWFTKTLLRLAASPSSVTAVSTAASALLTSMAGGCLLTLEGLNFVISACAAISAAVRRCAMRVLQTYLLGARGTPHQLAASAYVDAVHRVLRDGVTDADATVRADARRCFWSLHLLEPASAAVLLRVLPPNVRRLLAEERGRVLEDLQAVVATPVQAAEATPATRQQVGARLAGPRTEASRTMTLKDELQAAAARRTRSHGSRSVSPSTRHRQLLLLAKDLPYDPEKRPIVVHTAHPLYEEVNTKSRRMSLLNAMESTDWSVRRAAILQACELCEDGRLADDMPTFFSVLLLRLQDTQFRVVEAAQDCLRSCLQYRPATTQESLRGSLNSYLNAIFRNTTHVKPTVRHGARIVLDMLTRLHESPAKLLEAVLRSIDDAGGYAVEQRMAEFLLYFVLVHPSLFALQSITGATVRCAVTHISGPPADPSAEVHRVAAAAAVTAWSKVLGVLSLMGPEVFRDTFERLSPLQKGTVHAAFRECFITPRSGKEKTNAQDFDNSEFLTKIACVFAEQLKEAYAAQQMRLSTRGRRGQPSSTQSLGATSPPLHFVPPAVFPPLLKSLLMSPPPGDSSSVRQPSHLAQSHGATPQHSTSFRANKSSKQAEDHAAAFRRSFVSTLALPSETAGELSPADAVTAAFYNSVAAPLKMGDGEAVSHNAPAQFLHEWSSCRDAAAKRAALLRVAFALRHHATRQRNVSCAFGGCDGDQQPECVPEEAERLLQCWEREVGGAEYACDHRLRWAVFDALEALLGWSSARSAVARQLTRVITMCRHGMDDAFVEVQLQATTCFATAVLKRKLPLDFCLGALASCLSRWMDGPARDAATPGWLELLRMLQRLFEQELDTQLKASKGATGMRVDGQQKDSATAAFTVTSSVLQRVIAVVCQCLTHCNPAVRLSAVLVLAALLHAVGESTAASFLTALTPAQHHVLRVYRDRVPISVEDGS
ncbi:hypothetical protein ABB37_01139 [Leptomonas pyrrhocoris]|uniref:TOG domain-containing protein n=1 Tax=Leptomonas pyrrhocoris TaxID=157538 RepID=A0A0N0DYW9_LEPPY|nr:hypothetical protein ABB37_01139 [Leptomonas pyrrhocoris]KPA84615.1 hypothetical protein ABB37_01139 [Leptomonas pyrrhocoris]|eukprot:XP_015663054.1 hypothetical protein ABB37_01139 [Leptomonas pyrrhocoris]